MKISLIPSERPTSAQRLSAKRGRVGLGVQLGMAGKDAEALEQFSRAVDLKPGFLEARLNLGVALLRAHRPDEARAQFEEALRIRPSNPTAMQHLQQLEPDRKQR